MALLKNLTSEPQSMLRLTLLYNRSTQNRTLTLLHTINSQTTLMKNTRECLDSLMLLKWILMLLCTKLKAPQLTTLIGALQELFRVLKIKVNVVHAGLSQQPAQLKLPGLSLAEVNYLFRSSNWSAAQALTAIKAVVVVGISGLGNTWKLMLLKPKQVTHTLLETESLVLAEQTPLLVKSK